MSAQHMSIYTITTTRDLTGVAPAHCQWAACFGDADEGLSFGFGATEAEAVRDLLDNTVAPWGSA